MNKGQKVATVDRKIETVMSANESQIITYESAARGTWYHPTKVFAVYPIFDKTGAKRHVTIPE